MPVITTTTANTVRALPTDIAILSAVLSVCFVKGV